MILIVGLGNPGEKYVKTRHNLGFMVVDELGRKLLPLEKTRWQNDSRSNALILKVNPRLMLIKPKTFMNASGSSAVRVARFYKIGPENIWVIHDDLDLPLGKIKVKKGGGSAGHRGIESIVRESGNENFVRFRLGIGEPKKEAMEQKAKKVKDVEKFVLSSFDQKDSRTAKKMIKQTVKAIQLALDKGIERAMNQFN